MRFIAWKSAKVRGKNQGELREGSHRRRYREYVGMRVGRADFQQNRIHDDFDRNP